MIARTWGGRVPLLHAAQFYQHLIATGVEEYRQQPACLEVHLWRRDADGWAHFFLSSIWRDMDAIRAYAGETPEVAVLYPGDDVYELVPDTTVTHYEVLSLLVHQHPAPFVLDSSCVRPALETVSFHFNLEEGKSSPATRKEEI